MIKNPPANAGDAGDTGSIPESGRYPGEGNGNPPQYSCLGNPMDRGAWQAQSRGGQKELDMTEHIRVLFCQEGSPLHLVSFQNKQPTCWPEVLLGPDASGSRSSWNCTWETTEQADKSKPEPHC